MSQKVASLYASIGADTSGFEKGAKNVKRELAGIAPGVESAGAKLKNFAQANAALLTVLATAAYAAGRALKYSIDQAAEAELVDAKLAAVLASTGGAAGMTSNELNKMATALSRLSIYDDEAIKGSEALLLTFTKVGKEVFPEAQQAILNMSAALGQDLQSSTIQLGKALNDPIAGITALKRVGVSFTEEQRDMIKVMVAAGDTLGAQKLILHELTVEFGGQALAALNTYEGKVKSLKNEFGNLAEVVGEDTLPVLSDFVDFVNLSVRGWASFIEGAKRTAELRREAIALRDALDPSNPQWQDYIGMAIEMEQAQSKLNEEWRKSNGILEDDLKPTLEDIEADLLAVEKAEKELSDTISDQIGLINDIQSAEEDYTEKSKDLAGQRGEAEIRLADLRSQGYSEQSEQIQDALTDLQDVKDAEADLEKERERQTLQFVSNILAEQLARDGWTQTEFDAFADQQVAWGLWSEDVVEKAKAAWMEADKVAASISAIPDSKTSNILVNTTYAYSGWQGQTAGVTPFKTHAAGGMFEIPSGYGNEGFRLGNGDTASGGELISITPKGKASGGNNFYITVTADFADPETIARRLKPAVTRVMREAGVV